MIIRNNGRYEAYASAIDGDVQHIGEYATETEAMRVLVERLTWRLRDALHQARTLEEIFTGDADSREMSVASGAVASMLGRHTTDILTLCDDAEHLFADHNSDSGKACLPSYEVK